MKSIKTNPNSAKGPDKGKIVNKLHCILSSCLDYIFFRKKTDMKFIILVSNLKETSPNIFSWKKEYRTKTTMQFYCQNTIRPLKDTKLCLPYTCWKMEVGITTFLKFLLAKSSFLCRFRVESVNIFVLLRFELSTCSSINKQFTKFAHASGRMNIACVNNEILLDTRESNSDVFPSF
jgi:hypothetical protein